VLSWVTVVWAMVGATCLTLAAVHLLVWWRNREPASLALLLAAASTAVLALCELAQLKAGTLEVLAAAHRWSHVPIALLVISIAAFVHLHLGAGRLWLAAAAIGLRAVALVLNFTTGQSINFQAIIERRTVTLLGEPVSIAIGTVNPWQLVGQLGVVALLLFVVDAGVTAWRRGRRGAALAATASLAFLIAAGLVQSVLIFWGQMERPSTVSLFALGFVGVMAYALSADLLGARRLASELEERRREITLAADAANLGLWAHDLTTGVLTASAKWRELFGFGPDEPLHMDRLLARVHPSDRAEFVAHQTMAIAECGDYHTELRVLLPGGGTRWISSTGRAERGPGGQVVRTRGASIDTTPRKQAELEILRVRLDMAHVGRVAVMGQLAGTLAHEINQPLAAILRNAEAAALFLEQPVPDVAEIGAILEDIHRDDLRAGDVIDRMRSLLRRQGTAMERLDLAQVLRDVSALLRADAVARHVTLEISVPAGLPAVRGDRIQIQQVLLNLVMNGMDAVQGVPGGLVAVSVHHEEPQVLEVRVRDNGPGIPAAQLESVFEPFYTTKPNGLGIGLSISRGIIEAHGGRLWVRNEGGGAQFSFTLPIDA
jgi:two-component system sensor kinase FixL